MQQPNTNDSQRQMAYVTNTPFKSKVKAIEDDVFKMGAVKKAAQLSRSLLNITHYKKLKYSNEVGDAIWDLKHPVFTYPEMPEERIVMDKERNQIIEKPNEMNIFMWKRQWDGVNTWENDFKIIKRLFTH